MSVNKAFLIGRLGKDPEVRKINSTTTVCNFPLATREVYKNSDGTYTEQTEWHNIVMWRGIAERAERILKKGANVFIEGKIKTRSWEDKDGHKRYTTEIVVENFQLLDKKTEGSSTTTHDTDTAINDDAINSTDAIEQSFDDDLPF